MNSFDKNYKAGYRYGILDAIDLAEKCATVEGVIILLLRKRIECLVKEQKNG